ncbi:HGR092Cp [Eremothecium sinecaudum]|uniref:HGR092Cp n=1 Tax=Eremothecium sinecaudum TaxID=45286 RepID=A0A0X8HVT7_9SACH|nr:HGR092Cp [Eremothecium sinecaudum]AMD22431.1 HGR092Cp [Eremothecium sinecaudum]
MDSYNIKRENRKKFQNKERLKRRHATPSDRKYHQQGTNVSLGATETQQKDIEPEPELLSNEHRYYSDLNITYNDDTFDPEVLSKLKQVLAQRDSLTTDGSRPGEATAVTVKEIKSMTVDQLNTLLHGQKQIGDLSVGSNASSQAPAQVPHSAADATDTPPQLPRSVPRDLHADEDFLESLL